MSGTEQGGGEKEVFVSVLPSTLEALCGMQGAPHDDTILHHLLDVIKELITTEDDAQRSGLVDFVESVKERAHLLSSAVLVLALGVATHLASIAVKGTTDDLFWQRVTSMYKAIQLSGAAGRCSSVGAAYFMSLAKLAEHPKGLQWLENNRVHFKTALSTLETAESMFLLKAAENFVLTVLTHSLEADGENLKHSPPSSAMATEGVQLFTTELMEMKRSRSTLLDQMIVSSHVSPFHQSLIMIVCALTSSKTFCEWKAGDEALVCSLAHLAVEHLSEKVQSSALQSLVNLVGCMSQITREEFLMKEILTPLLKIMAEGGVERVVSVAVAFWKAWQTTDEKSEALQSLGRLVHLPHDVLFGHQHSQDARLTALVSAVTAALCDRNRLPSLIPSILHAIRQTHHSEGLVRLVQSAGLTRDDEDWPSVISSWPLGMGAVVVGNTKLLNALFVVLQQDCCLDLTIQQCSDVLMTLMRIMRRTLVESRVYSQCSGAFVNIVSLQYQSCAPGERGQLEKTLTHWAELMEYRLTALQWEIRDTTLELLTKVLGIVTDTWFRAVVKDHHLLRLAWGCTKYGDSYPRASAIALATSLTASPLWGDFLQDADLTEASLADDMMEVLATDSEAFPRRAAVQLLTALMSRSPEPCTTMKDRTMQRSKVCAAITAAINDFDWDVKLKVLDFWDKLAAPLLACVENAGKEPTGVNRRNKKERADSKLHRKRAAPEQNSGISINKYDMLEALLRDGFGKTVLSSTEDYDSAVKQRGLRMLLSMQLQMDGEEEESATKAKKMHGGSNTERSDCVDSISEGTPNSELVASSEVSVNEFLKAVRRLDPGRVLQQQSQSVDEYRRKPTSLLEDVMAAVKQSTTVHEVAFMSEDEFEDGDAMFVDCY